MPCTRNFLPKKVFDLTLKKKTLCLRSMKTLFPEVFYVNFCAKLSGWGKYIFKTSKNVKLMDGQTNKLLLREKEANKGMMGHFYSKFIPIFNKVFGSNG